MHSIRLDEGLFHGTVSVERTPSGLRPWRLPFHESALFAPALRQRGVQPAGVRIGLFSSTRAVQVNFAPSDEERQIDCVIDYQLHETAAILPGVNTIRFENMPAGPKRIELYLPHLVQMVITGLAVDDDATWQMLEVDRPRWVAYGSSITQCKGAASPALTWPALVARRQGLHLTCLGYGAQCHLEPMVALMIRDLPADFISLCLGINVMGGATLGVRAFRHFIIGMVKIIREKHPNTPMVVQSPIYSAPRETTKNAVGFSLQTMRVEVAEAVSALQAMGDIHLHYLDGLKILGPEYERHLPDALHPDAEGYRIMADNFERHVMEEMGMRQVVGMRA